MQQNKMLIEMHQALIKQNQETNQQVLKLCENGTHNITNNTNNSHNKSFNINIFLNEQCKDAINFSQFIENIKVSQDDLVNIGDAGFVDGISKVLIDQLNELGTFRRPIHCTDQKRNTVYIKNDD